MYSNASSKFLHMFGKTLWLLVIVLSLVHHLTGQRESRDDLVRKLSVQCSINENKIKRELLSCLIILDAYLKMENWMNKYCGPLFSFNKSSNPYIVKNYFQKAHYFCLGFWKTDVYTKESAMFYKKNLLSYLIPKATHFFHVIHRDQHILNIFSLPTSHLAAHLNNFTLCVLS